MNLKRPLLSLFPENVVNAVFSGYEVIGDIAIISIEDAYEHMEEEIAHEILGAYKDLRLVAKRLSSHSGEFRIATLQKIGGQGGFDTVHKEFGILLHVNPDAAYFSPRSGSERYRVAQQVRKGELVLVMFSGVGPFPLMIGYHSKASRVVGVEKNPHAHRLALKNAVVNKKAQNVEFLCGDVKSILPGLNTMFDRIVMPLPLAGTKYLQLALRHLLPGGILHYYEFQYKDEFELSMKAVHQACVDEGREVVDSKVHLCGHIGLRRYRVCVDARVN